MKKKRSKLFIGLLSTAMVLAPLSMASAKTSDISNHWAGNQLEKWVDKGYISGYQDGTIKPDKEITRAEFITLVNRAFNFQNEASISYKDVEPNQWFYKEIAKAQAAGYIKGYNDGTMKPDKKVTREEMAVIVSSLLNLDTQGTEQEIKSFSDSSSIAAWSKGAIGALVKKGILRGYKDNTFKPKKTLTRAEGIVALDNSISGAPLNAEPKPQSTEDGFSLKANHTTVAPKEKVDISIESPSQSVYSAEWKTDGGTLDVKQDQKSAVWTAPDKEDSTFTIKVSIKVKDGDGKDKEILKSISIKVSKKQVQNGGRGGGGTPSSTQTSQGQLDSGITVTATSNVAATFTTLQNSSLGSFNTPALAASIIGKPFEISATSQPNSNGANLTFNLPTLPNGVTQPRLAYYNPTKQQLEMIPGQNWDAATNTLTAHLSHFSTYVLVDNSLFAQTWKDNLIRENSSNVGQPTTRDSIDFVFVIDSSGSMINNDPNDSRKDGVKGAIDTLTSNDLAAIVDFDDNVTLLQGLTNDKGLLKNAVDSIDSSGSTNIGAGLGVALNVLAGSTTADQIQLVTSADTINFDKIYMEYYGTDVTSYDTINILPIEPNQTRTTTNKMRILLLTDGLDNSAVENIQTIKDKLVATAKTRNIIIDTMGLGQDIDVDLLKYIAEQTGGSYYYVDSAEILKNRLLQASMGATGTALDTDQDGLPDWVETMGYTVKGYLTVDSNGNIVPKKIAGTDPTKADTDGDGISDKDELGDVFYDSVSNTVYVSPEVVVDQNQQYSKPYVSNPTDPTDHK
jgi:Mg-chelatase subunit ChlD